MRSRFRSALLVVAIAMTTACGSSDSTEESSGRTPGHATIDPKNPDDLAWTSHMSAPNMYGVGILPLLFIGLGAATFCTQNGTDPPMCTEPPPDCPHVSTGADGSTIIEGGCTTDDGVT